MAASDALHAASQGVIAAVNKLQQLWRQRHKVHHAAGRRAHEMWVRTASIVSGNAELKWPLSMPWKMVFFSSPPSAI